MCHQAEISEIKSFGGGFSTLILQVTIHYPVCGPRDVTMAAPIQIQYIDMAAP